MTVEAAATEAGRALVAAADALVADAATLDHDLAGARITAIGWATVDLDRAEQELGEALGGRLAARPSRRDQQLGARARSADPFIGGPTVILLEPDTEGLLAAILARHGEGVALVIVETASGTRSVKRARRVLLTSGPGGRPPSARAGRRPSAGA